jgi:hypothetical protein
MPDTLAWRPPQAKPRTSPAARPPAITHSASSRVHCSAAKAATAIAIEPQWVESYITDNKMYDVYIAPDEQILRLHAHKAGLPINRVSRIRAIADPTTAESNTEQGPVPGGSHKAEPISL